MGFLPAVSRRLTALTVGGGDTNTASGQLSTVPGGSFNGASGLNSFAAGFHALAIHQGAFVWADASTATNFASSAAEEFSVRASGGTRIFSNNTLTAGVTLAAGASAWASVSDRNLKENFSTVDHRVMLEKLAAIPILTWNYKSQAASIRHIGPMAQDFYAAFSLGESDERISTIDADGVALAAVQGLYKLQLEKDATIRAQQQQIESLRRQLEDLRAAVAALAAEGRTAGRN